MNVMRSFLAMDPLPSHSLSWNPNGNQQHEHNKHFLPPSVPRSLYLCVIPSPASCSASCLTGCLFAFCFVRKAHQEPKWIWKHLHRCLQGEKAARSHIFCVKIHLPHRRQQFGWKTWSYYAWGISSPDGAEHWVANWGKGERIICKVRLNRSIVPLQ